MCGTHAYGNKQKKGTRPIVLNGRVVGSGALPRTSGRTVLNGKKTRGTRQMPGDDKSGEHKKGGAVGWIVALGIIIKIGSELLSGGALGDVGAFAREKIAAFGAEVLPSFSVGAPEPDYAIPESLTGTWNVVRADGLTTTLLLQPDSTYTLHEEGKDWTVRDSGTYSIVPEAEDEPRADGLPPREEFTAYYIQFHFGERDMRGEDMPAHWRQNADTYALTLYEAKSTDNGTLIAVDDSGLLLPSGAEVLQRVEE